MSEKLKRCPVCGSGNEVYQNTLGDGRVGCSICGTEAPFNAWQGHRLAQGEGVNAAVSFEDDVREVIVENMKNGLTLTNAIGVLSLIQMELSNSFLINAGLIGKESK